MIGNGIRELAETCCFNQQYSPEDTAVFHLLYLFTLSLESVFVDVDKAIPDRESLYRSAP